MSDNPLRAWDRNVAPWTEPEGAPVRGTPGLRLAIARASGAVVVTVDGEVDGAGSEILGDTLRDLIDGQGNLFVVVDLADAVVGDPGALNVLATARRSLEARDGCLFLAKPSHETAGALRAAGLGDVIEIHPERRHHPSTTRGRSE